MVNGLNANSFNIQNFGFNMIMPSTDYLLNSCVSFNPFMPAQIMMGGTDFPISDTQNLFSFPYVGTDYSMPMGDPFSSAMYLFSSMINNNVPAPNFTPEPMKTNFNTRTDLPQLRNVYNPELGNKLASVAYSVASRKKAQHRCYNGVKEILTKAGYGDRKFIGSISAYKAAGILSQSRNFKEVHVPREGLKKLPAGCVIVWNKYPSGKKSFEKHGHVAITLGDGREASDHVANRTYILKSEYKVFVPVSGVNINA